ncbi:MAG: hypothetical protein LLG37_05580 [Spirochaetia bacterium]|nr:hypothetical protein [Spirochaetia bacterium]
MKLKYGLLIVSLSFFFLTGCARVYLVNVDSINDNRDNKPRVYQILPGNRDVSTYDLQFKEYAGLLVRALSVQGYVLADDTHPAEFEIYLSYGVGEPESHTYSYTTPVWGQTGTDVYSVTTHRKNPDNTVTEYSQTSVDPQYGITGFTSQTAEYTVYRKYIILDAFDIKNVKPGTKLNEIWKTSISSVGQSKNLRRAFPGMLAAAASFIGGNTGGEISVSIEKDADLTRQIKGLPAKNR